MSKISIVALMISFIICLSSCSQADPSSSTSDSPVSTDGFVTMPLATPPSVPPATTFPVPGTPMPEILGGVGEDGTPRLPDITQDMLDVYKHRYKLEPFEETLPLAYEITRPPKAFFEAMNSIGDEEYAPLKDQKNILHVEDYVIFYTYDARDGLYKVVMEDREGNSSIIFASSQNIRSLRFFNRTQLTVELKEIQYYEGSGSRCYVIDLENETLRLQYDDLLVDSTFGTYFWYDGHLIKTGGNLGPYPGIDNLNLVLEDGAEVLLAEKANEYVVFDQGKMYYTLYEETENSKLFSIDLNTLERNCIYAFSNSRPDLFYVKNGMLFIRNGACMTIYDVSTNIEPAIELITLELAENYTLSSATPFHNNSIVWLDEDTMTLWRTSFDGEREKLLQNLDSNTGFAISGDTVYLSRGSGYIWKADLSTKPFVMESTLP